MDIEHLNAVGYIVQFAIDPDTTHDGRYHVQLVHFLDHSQYLAEADSFEDALRSCVTWALD